MSAGVSWHCDQIMLIIADGHRSRDVAMLWLANSLKLHYACRSACFFQSSFIIGNYCSSFKLQIVSKFHLEPLLLYFFKRTHCCEFLMPYATHLLLLWDLLYLHEHANLLVAIIYAVLMATGIFFDT